MHVLVCAGVCVLQVCMHTCVDVHVCIHSCVHQWLCCRYMCVHRCRLGVHTSVCVHACAVGVHTWRSPRVARTWGFPALGCARGGLGPIGCSSPQQKQPPLPGTRQEWGSACTTPQHLLGSCWLLRPCPQARAPQGLGDTGTGLGMFSQDGCFCVVPWSTVASGASGLCDCSWPLGTCVGLVAPLGPPQLVLSGPDIPVPVAAPLRVAFCGGAGPAWCQPCPVPSQRAEQELVATAVGRGAQEPFIPLKPPPCLSADPESQRKRTVQNVLDLRQNLEETMSSLRGSQVSHR